MNLTEIIGALAIAIASIIAATYTFFGGRKAEEAASEDKAISQVYAGYGGLLQRLQDDNANLRARLKLAEDRLDAADARDKEAREAAKLQEKEWRDAVKLADKRLATAEARIVELLEQLKGA